MEVPAQASQPSYEPENPDPDRDTQENLLRVPWIDVISELRSVQQSCRQLRTQVQSITSNADTSDIVAKQDALSSEPQIAHLPVCQLGWSPFGQ